jgi:hypothetical protein
MWAASWPRFLDHLYAGRAGAEHADALALEIDAFLRPARGVQAAAAEVVQARNVRRVGLRADAGAQHQEARRGAWPALGLHLPAAASLRRNARRSPACCNGCPGSRLSRCRHGRSIRESCPRTDTAHRSPSLATVHRQGELVERPVGIAARAGIAVPVPHAAQRRRGLVDLDLEAELAQAMELVQAGESRRRRPARRVVRDGRFGTWHETSERSGAASLAKPGAAEQARR